MAIVVFATWTGDEGMVAPPCERFRALLKVYPLLHAFRCHPLARRSKCGVKSMGKRVVAGTEGKSVMHQLT